MKEKQLTNLLAAVVRQVATEDVYLDRALRDIFKDKKVVDPNIRRALSLYAPFVFRNWYALGGGSGESIISIVNKALEIPVERIDGDNVTPESPDFPQWFIDLSKEELGGSWEQELIAFASRPKRYIRTDFLLLAERIVQ